MRGPLEGLTLFTRGSDGSLGLISYHPRHSGTWYWSIRIVRAPTSSRFWLVMRAAHRRNQWHDYYRLPFGRALLVSRQDYHLREAA